MNPNICLEKARKMAANAKPGILNIGGKTYTFMFCQTEWHYKVYEDMMFMMNINTKNITKAKQFLRDFLSN